MKNVQIPRPRWAIAACTMALLSGCAAAPITAEPAPTPAPAPAPETPPSTPVPTPAPPETAPAPQVHFDFTPSGDERIDVWRVDFAQRSLASGRSRAAVTEILTDLSPLSLYLGDENTVSRSAISEQAEFAKPIWEYLASAVSETRKTEGAAKLAATPDLFDGLEARYGVDRDVLVAIWGMETNFGGFIGVNDAANALANMAVEGRRRSFAESELIALMKLIEMGLVERADLVSGWAGAMGQTQFMPSTFLAHAEDFEGDGLKDVWNNPADALASAANYLALSGYRKDQPWGVEVSTPPNFDFSLANGTRRDMAFWQAAGLAPTRGGPFQTGGATAAELWLPAGADGPKFLLFDNFNVFKTYNRADSYALAVGLLSDGVNGSDTPLTAWPTDLEPLSVAEIKELQAGLNTLGFEAGIVDGIAGRGTKGALQAFQKARGFPADGYPTKLMLAYVLGEASGG